MALRARQSGIKRAAAVWQPPQFDHFPGFQAGLVRGVPGLDDEVVLARDPKPRAEHVSQCNRQSGSSQYMQVSFSLPPIT